MSCDKILDHVCLCVLKTWKDVKRIFKVVMLDLWYNFLIYREGTLLTHGPKYVIELRHQLTIHK